MKEWAIVLVCCVGISACKQHSPLRLVNQSEVNVESKNGLTYVDGSLFTGELFLKDAKGLLIKRHQYAEGKKNGLYKVWFPNAQLRESRMFVDNKKSGLHQGFLSNGQPKFEYHFDNGKYTDTLKEWYPNGQLYKLEYYENGKQVGRQKAWRKNGELFLNYDVKNGRKYGNAGIKHCKSIWNERIDSI